LEISLPVKAIDRLFERLSATYGAAWTRQLADAPINDVKSAWAHELAGFAGHLEALAWGLENLPERCPNVIEFRNLCRRAPEKEVPRLPEPKANPERLKAELAKLGESRKAIAQKSGRDHKEWARAIIANHESGGHVNAVSLRFAREALG
jgi:hypothetical protein